jgi:hypothetical protein
VPAPVPGPGSGVHRLPTAPGGGGAPVPGRPSGAAASGAGVQPSMGPTGGPATAPFGAMPRAGAAPLGGVPSGGHPVPHGAHVAARGGNRNLWIALAAIAAVALIVVIVLSQGGDSGSGSSGYTAEVESAFVSSCTANGSPDAMCQCAYDEFEATVPFERFEEIDADLRDDPTAVPPELVDIFTECADAS